MVYMRTFLLDKMEYTFFHFQIYELDSVSVMLSQHNQKEVFALWLIPFICTLEIFPIHIMYFLFSFTKREESKPNSSSFFEKDPTNQILLMSNIR